MASQPKQEYSEALLRELWAAGKSHMEIAAALGCSVGYVARLRAMHNLPRRSQQPDYDPTPEEIAERAAECRARHFAERRGESVHAAIGRKKTADSTRFPAIRTYRAKELYFIALDELATVKTPPKP